MKVKKWRILNQEYLYEKQFLTIRKDTVELPNKTIIKDYHIIENRDWVNVIAITDEGLFVFEKQYRYAYGEEVWELPAGKLEKGENSYDAGIRELEEEVGLRAESLIDMGEMYPSCGYTDEIIHLYIAHNVTKVPRHLDEDENIDIYYFSIDEVEEMIMKGQIKDAKTISLVFKYLNK